MGFFSKIWKAVKSVFTGIKNVFKAILKPIGKLLNSSFGKALMIGLSIFTLGTAMVAGFQAFAASNATGFMAKFVEGASAFMGSLTGGAVGKNPTPPSDAILGAGEAAVQGAETAATLQGGGAAGLVEGATQASTGALGGANQIVQGGNKAVQAAGDMVGGGGSLSEAIGAGTSAGMPGPTQALAKAGGSLATRTPPPNPGWLEKAKTGAGKFMTGVKDFAQTPGGGQVVGSMVQGVGNYYTEKDRQEFEDRVRKDWMSGDSSSGVRNVRAQAGRVSGLRAPSAQGIADASRSTARNDPNARRPYFNRAYGASGG